MTISFLAVAFAGSALMAMLLTATCSTSFFSLVTGADTLALGSSPGSGTDFHTSSLRWRELLQWLREFPFSSSCRYFHLRFLTRYGFFKAVYSTTLLILTLSVKVLRFLADDAMFTFVLKSSSLLAFYGYGVVTGLAQGQVVFALCVGGKLLCHPLFSLPHPSHGRRHNTYQIIFGSSIQRVWKLFQVFVIFTASGSGQADCGEQYSILKKLLIFATACFLIRVCT